MEKKMFIYLDGIDTTDAVAANESRAPSAEGIVTYQCKMYQTVLAQGTASRRSQRPASSTAYNLLTVRLWGPSRLTQKESTQD
jgi:hypothetical protein